MFYLTEDSQICVRLTDEVDFPSEHFIFSSPAAVRIGRHIADIRG